MIDEMIQVSLQESIYKIANIKERFYKKILCYIEIFFYRNGVKKVQYWSLKNTLIRANLDFKESV